MGNAKCRGLRLAAEKVTSDASTQETRGLGHALEPRTGSCPRARVEGVGLDWLPRLIVFFFFFLEWGNLILTFHF